MSAAALPFPSTSTSASPSRGLYPSLWRHAASARVALVAGALLLIASQLLRLAFPWFTGQAINALQTAGPDYALKAGGWICALIGTCALVWLLHGPGRILERAVGVRVRRSVSEALLDRLSHAPIAWHDRHPASDLQQRMGQAAGALDDFAQSQYIVLQSTVTFVGTLSALVLFSPDVGIVAVVAYLLLVAVGRRFDRTMTRLAAQQNDAERRYASGVLEFVSGIATMTALRLAPSARRLLGHRLDAIFVPLKRSIRLNEAKWCVVDLLTTALTWAVVALYVWRVHGSGAAVMIGGVFMVHQYAEQAGGVVSAAASHLQNFARARVNFASAAPIWDAPVRPAPGATLDADWQRLELHGVGYAHRPADEADTGRAPKGIERVSLTIERGERIALVGPSGSGKSTLMRVIAGLYDADQGHVTVDGIAHLGVRPLASITTLIPQDVDVFEATVWENIALDTLPGEGAVRAALATSAFDEVLATLPQGLATPIAERGVNLSGGQRQRLGLARGVLAAGDSTLIVLDEPTSALDPLTEARVYRALDQHFPSATLVASVHRMSLLEHFDRVVLMDGGRVLDTGTAEAVCARQPLLAAMVAGQHDGADGLKAA